MKKGKTNEADKQAAAPIMIREERAEPFGAVAVLR
jgi:hypothetical protein